MNTNNEISIASTENRPVRRIKIFGVGGAGLIFCDLLNRGEFAGADFAAIDTDTQSVEASSATVKVHLETKLLRGLGTGGDPERGHALAEEQFSTFKCACEGAEAVLILAGLGGGAGSGVSPVLARAAKESGALVLAFVTMPFLCEGNRRQQQALAALHQLKAAADGVVCLPNQKAFKLIDENTSVIETFRITGGFLLEGVRGVWQLLTCPGLIQIHLEDLCGLMRDQHSESALAFVEASGPARSREIVEKLLAHPLLDEGRALSGARAVLVSLTGGKDLTMTEIHRVMEKINSHCDGAKIIMGAAIDAGMANKLSVALIAAKKSPEQPESAGALAPLEPRMVGGPDAARECPPSGSRFDPRFLTSAPGGSSERPGARHGRIRRADRVKMLQGQLPLTIVSKGRFDKSEPTIHKGEDLDVPTFIRRGVPLN
ncbi:MAG: cell division protein FtsZ [Limisphaerales bacterium]